MTDTTYDEFEDDEDDFLEGRDLTQCLLDFVLFPLMFIAVASLLILVTCGSLWGSVKLVMLITGTFT